MSIEKRILSIFLMIAMIVSLAPFIGGGEAWAESTPNYLTFTAQGTPSSITFKYSTGSAVAYSTDGATWNAYSSGTAIDLSSGSYVKFRGIGVKTDTFNHFEMTGKIAASGSVTSLTDGNGVNQNVTLEDGCYANMFYGCTSLVTAPELPATTLAQYCYNVMFSGCTSLTTAPELSATTLANGCYRGMFVSCTSLQITTSSIGAVKFFECPSNLTHDEVTNMFQNISKAGIADTPTAGTYYYVSSAPSAPTTSVAAIGSTGYPTVQAAVNAATSGSTIKLLANTTGNAIVVSKEGITLDLNGYVLSGEGNGNHSVITVESTGSLTITDSGINSKHYFRYSTQAAWELDAITTSGITVGAIDKDTPSGTSIEIFGGCITGGNSTSGGGAVYNEGELILNSGNIVGNTTHDDDPGDSVDAHGGGINVDEGSFAMNGGNIIGNSTPKGGGGVYTNLTTSFTMNGGNISHNSCKESGGGVNNNKTFTINGGTISYNKAVHCGGGIYNANSGSMDIRNSYIINNDVSGGTDDSQGNGGGIYNTVATITLSAVTIKGNKAELYGGGIYNHKGKLILTGSSITSNTAVSGGGIYVTDPTTCLPMGTKVIMADGSQKNIEDIRCGDYVKTFDHEAGKLSSSRVYLVYEGEDKSTPFYLNFTNDIKLGIVGLHDLLEKDSRKYVQITESNAESYIGKLFYNASTDTWEELLNVSYSNELTSYYSIYTANHFNCIAEGMLTVPDDVDYMLNIYELDANLKANQEILANDIATYGIVEYDGMISREYYNELNIKYINIVIGKGFKTFDELLKLYNEYNNGSVLSTAYTSLAPAIMCNAGSSTEDSITFEDLISNAAIGTIILGSGVVIRYNSVSNSAVEESNIYLDKKAYIAVRPDDLKTCKIGVDSSSNDDVQITSGTALKDASRFKADNPKRYIAVSGNALWLVSGSAFSVSINTDGHGKVNNASSCLIHNIISGASITSDGAVLSISGAAVATASALSGYKFKCWEISPASATVTTNMTITAKFEQIAGGNTGGYINIPTQKKEEALTYSNCKHDGTCPMNSFSDLDATLWYHDGIHYCIDQGYLQGDNKGLMQPNADITRAQTVTVLWRMAGEPVVNYAMSFSDVSEDLWYTEAVRWAASEGIVKGYNNDIFGPDDAITREALAQILYGYAKKQGDGFTGSWMFLLSNPDARSISSWANEAMHWTVMKQITNGDEDRNLNPQGLTTRAEAAAMIQRFCELEK